MTVYSAYSIYVNVYCVYTGNCVYAGQTGVCVGHYVKKDFLKILLLSNVIKLIDYLMFHIMLIL